MDIKTDYLVNEDIIINNVDFGRAAIDCNQIIHLDSSDDSDTNNLSIERDDIGNIDGLVDIEQEQFDVNENGIQASTQVLSANLEINATDGKTQSTDNLANVKQGNENSTKEVTTNSKTNSISTEVDDDQSQPDCHQRAKIKKPQLQCTFCSYKSTIKSNFTRHLKIHGVLKQYKCNFCKYTSTAKMTLKYHLATHTGEKPLTCDICDYKCVKRSDLSRHWRVHTGEKPYRCTQCNYKCITRTKLTEHLRIHTGEKPYCCNVCDYKSPTKTHLTRHLRTHTGERPFGCTLCDYRCAEKKDLTRHLKSHLENKTLVCDFCDYKTIRKSTLRQHMNTHVENTVIEIEKTNGSSTDSLPKNSLPEAEEPGIELHIIEAEPNVKHQLIFREENLAFEKIS